MHQDTEWYPPSGTGHPGSQGVFLWPPSGHKPAPGFATESLEPGHASHTLPASSVVETSFENSYHCDSPTGQGFGKTGDWPAHCSGSEIGLLPPWPQFYPYRWRQVSNLAGGMATDFLQHERNRAVPLAAQRGPTFHQLPWNKALSEPWNGQHRPAVI